MVLPTAAGTLKTISPFTSFQLFFHLCFSVILLVFLTMDPVRSGFSSFTHCVVSSAWFLFNYWSLCTAQRTHRETWLPGHYSLNSMNNYRLTFNEGHSWFTRGLFNSSFLISGAFYELLRPSCLKPPSICHGMNDTFLRENVEHEIFVFNLFGLKRQNSDGGIWVTNG